MRKGLSGTQVAMGIGVVLILITLVVVLGSKEEPAGTTKKETDVSISDTEQSDSAARETSTTAIQSVMTETAESVKQVTPSAMPATQKPFPSPPPAATATPAVVRTSAVEVELAEEAVGEVPGDASDGGGATGSSAPTDAGTRSGDEVIDKESEEMTEDEMPDDVGGATSAITEPEIMVEVASVPLVVRNTSGLEIGDGILRVYAPKQVSYPQTARIELELSLSHQYISPTPRASTHEVIRMTSTPRDDMPTPTERLPIYEESGLSVYQRMGASLTCLAESFSNCDEAPDPAKARIIDLEGEAWSWIISPQEAARGFQDLELSLWTLKSIDGGAEQADIIWSYAFQVEANPRIAEKNNEEGNSGLAVLAVAIIVGMLLVTGILFMRQRQFARTSADSLSIFLSYRRAKGWAVARSVHDYLQKHKINVFIDVDDINEGRFVSIIEEAITQCDYFVPILTPGTLESEWVQREIALAIEKDKVIIPLLADGFLLDKEGLPQNIQDLAVHNAITLTPEFFEAGMERLLKFVTNDEIQTTE